MNITCDCGASSTIKNIDKQLSVNGTIEISRIDKNLYVICDDCKAFITLYKEG